MELLDPAKDICDEFDGILCKVRKGKYEINLPLTELEVPQDSPNFSSSKTTGSGFGTGGESKARRAWLIGRSSANPTRGRKSVIRGARRGICLTTIWPP